MRLITTLNIAVATALATTALFGVSSASADDVNILLCQHPELKCLVPFPSPTTLVGHATNPKILSNLGTVECEKALMELTVLNELSSLVLGHLLASSLEGNCHLGGTACTVTTNELGLVSITKTGPLKTKVKSTGGKKATIKCGSFINCSVAGEPTLEGSSTEGGETTLVANKVVLKGGGFLCPSTMEWDATYTFLGTMYLES